MAKNFKELQAKMAPGSRARSAAKADQLIRNMALDELRLARHLTQEHLAKIVGVNQAAISKMERRTDVYVSTLADFIHAMGGALEIRAVFPEGSVRINQFGKTATASEGGDDEESPRQRSRRYLAGRSA